MKVYTYERTFKCLDGTIKKYNQVQTKYYTKKNIDENIVNKIKKLRGKGVTIAQLEKQFNMSRYKINKIIKK